MGQFQQSLDEELKQHKQVQQLQNVESIIATRARRANAGNRLQSLLNAETPLIEEDETTNDIFRELDDDDDYDVAEESQLQSASEEENEEDEAIWETNKRKSSEQNTTRRPKRVKSSTPANQQSSDDDINQKDDDMFSDSADSISEDDDEDDDEGEKEIAKQQREERRRNQKRKRDAIATMPASLAKAQQRQKQRAKDAESDGLAEIERIRLLKRQRMRLSADNLMSENRRRSTRKAAVKNKEDVIQRLKESEARRAKQPTPTAKVVHHITQEERLAEAVITEKKNIESLNSFYEQEEDRKKKQRAALLAKRVPMTSFIRYVSKTTLVPASIPKPFVEEIAPPPPKLKREWKKRKDAKVKDETPKPEVSGPEKEEEKVECNNIELQSNKEANGATAAPVEVVEHPPPIDNRRSTSVEQMEADYIIFGEDDPEKKEEPRSEESPDVHKTENGEQESMAKHNVTNGSLVESEAPAEIAEAPMVSNEVPEVVTETPVVSDKVSEVVTEAPDIESEVPVLESKTTEQSEAQSDVPTNEVKEEPTITETPATELALVPSDAEPESVLRKTPETKEKSPSSILIEEVHPDAAEKTDTTSIEQEQEVEHIDPSKLVVEGPPACRALTTISFMEFPQDFHYSLPEMKTILFGPQSLDIPVIPDRTAMKPYPTSAAATHAILRAKVSGAGVSGAKGRKPKNDANKKTPKKLSQLGAGRGGIFGAVGGSSSSIVNALTGRATGGAVNGVQTPRASLALTTTPVAPATAATPTGASAAATLANAGIPKCVVTGKPCKFVDPRTGIPYSSMEAFQIIRTVTNNTVPWNRDFGVFVSAIGSRHAKGVPPGFGDPVENVMEE